MTDKFKLKCKEFTYQDRLGKIEYDNDQVISGSDYLQKIVIDDSCITNGTIVGSIYAKSITFETLEVYDLSDKEIDAQIGVIYDDNSTEYIKMGKYTIQDETNQETAKNGQYKGLDNLRLLDTEYVCNITDFANITIKDFLVDVCNQLNLTLGTTNFTNDNLPVKGNPFTNKETCRTVLKSILNCSLNFAIIDVDTNSLVIRWLDDEVSETFTKDDYDNLEKNNVYSPINSLIIRDSVISGENVIRQDEISIAEIGENQFIIEDTYFLYTEELRDLAIDNLWDKVKGLTYIDCKLTTSLGRPYLKVGQKISIEDDNGNYFDTYVLKHQFTYDGTFYSVIESPALTKEEEKRKNTTDIKTRFRNTERIVDKINGQIIDIIEEQTDTKDRLNQTISTLDGTTQTVSKVETDIANITNTTQESIGGNHLCIDDTFNSNALEYTIHGKSEQEVAILGSRINYFNFKTWKNNVGVNQGNISFDGETLIMSNPTSTDQYTILFPNVIDSTEKTKKSCLEAGVNIENWSYLTLSYDNPNHVKSQSHIFLYDENFNLLETYSSEITTDENGRHVQLIVGPNAKYCYFRIDNKSFGEDNTTLIVKNVTIINSVWYNYIPFIIPKPTPTNPSEIKTIPNIRNLLDTDLSKITNKGLNFEYEGSTVKIDGTSTNVGQNIVKTKTKLKKGIYTISFWKLGGTLERKDSNDCQLFVQTSDGTTERLTNITGTRLENGENAKTTITLKEEKEIYLYFYHKDSLIFNNYEIGVQIEKGSIAHDYRPSGSWAKIRVTGENQFFLRNPSCRGYSYGLPHNTTNSIEIKSYDSNNLSFSMTANGYAYILSNTHYLKPNTDYLLSYNRKNNNYPAPSNTRYYIYDFDENGDYVLNQNSSDPDGDKQYLFTTNNKGMVAFAWGGDNKCSGASSIISNIMIVEKVDNVEYEPSKENEVLIDLNKPNLFNKNDYGFVQNANIDSTGLIKDDSVFDLLYFKLSKGTYKIFNSIENDYLVITNTTDIPNIGTQGNGRVVKRSDTCMYTMNNDGYLVIRVNRESGVSINELVENLKATEGYEDYYELCTDDTLKIEGDNVELHKEIEKIILDGSENWGYNNGQFYINGSGYKTYSEGGKCTSSHYLYKFQEDKEIWIGNSNFILIKDSNFSNLSDFKNWLSENPITVYYKLAEPQDILLQKAEIPLFDGVNHIQFMDDIQTETSVYFIKKTLLSDEYVIQPQLNQTNKNLSITDDKTNKNASDINSTNTNLNNNYYNKDQIDVMNTSTEQIITQIRNQVEMTTSATNLQISVLEEKIINGATSVTTETGYKFDKDGLSISKTGEPMRSLLDNDGLTVFRDNVEMLSVRSDGVNAENITVRTYLTIGKNTRVEDYKTGTGFFYIGGAS